MDLFLAIYFLTISFLLFHLCNLVFQWRDQCCYILDYQLYKGSDDMKLDIDSSSIIRSRNTNLGPDELKFLLKTISKSGIGDETYGPKSILYDQDKSLSLSDSISELEEIFFHTLDKIFSNSKISPSKIDILVVNVPMISCAPSLFMHIIKHYNMRNDIKVYNLTSMGCSASLIAINLVQNLFKTRKNAFAIVVNSESISQNWYNGKEKSMLLTSCLFRTGGCSILLTNCKDSKYNPIFKLRNMVRTNLASKDEAYECCQQIEDGFGHRGIFLSKNLPKVAASAITINLKELIPKILPIHELVRYFILNYILKKKTNFNFKTGIDHFCLHPGGRAVIDGFGKSLGINEYDLEPTRMALHRFGNTSVSGLWYVMNYMEAKKRLKKGDRVLMISVGSGVKCNTCVWEVMKDLGNDDGRSWHDFWEKYPEKSLVNRFMERYIELYGENEERK